MGGICTSASAAFFRTLGFLSASSVRRSRFTISGETAAPSRVVADTKSRTRAPGALGLGGARHQRDEEIGHALVLRVARRPCTGSSRRTKRRSSRAPPRRGTSRSRDAVCPRGRGRRVRRRRCGSRRAPRSRRVRSASGARRSPRGAPGEPRSSRRGTRARPQAAGPRPSGGRPPPAACGTGRTFSRRTPARAAAARARTPPRGRDRPRRRRPVGLHTDSISAASARHAAHDARWEARNVMSVLRRLRPGEADEDEVPDFQSLAAFHGESPSENWALSVSMARKIRVFTAPSLMSSALAISA